MPTGVLRDTYLLSHQDLLEHNEGLMMNIRSLNAHHNLHYIKSLRLPAQHKEAVRPLYRIPVTSIPLM